MEISKQTHYQTNPIYNINVITTKLDTSSIINSLHLC